jgi:pimeloyl-[acyl-carrier protein] methyl ester esterase
MFGKVCLTSTRGEDKLIESHRSDTCSCTVNRYESFQLNGSLDIVLLHGWGFSSGVWCKTLTFLRARFNVYVVDLPGYGQNDLYSENVYCIDNLIQSLLLVVPKKAVYCGWSLGANIIASLAMNSPERVLGVIAIAGSPKFVSEDGFPGVDEGTAHSFSRRLERSYKVCLSYFAALCVEGDPHKLELKKTLFSYANWRAQTGVLEKSLDLTLCLDNRKILNSLCFPQYYILAEGDQFARLALKRYLSRCKFIGEIDVIADASHACILSHADEICEKIFLFCDRYLENGYNEPE